MHTANYLLRKVVADCLKGKYGDVHGNLAKHPLSCLGLKGRIFNIEANQNARKQR